LSPSPPDPLQATSIRTTETRPEAASKEATKGEAQTKQAEGGTLDDLIAETLRKAAEIAGTSRSAACKKVVEIVTKAPSVSSADKTIIAEKLGSVVD